MYNRLTVFLNKYNILTEGQNGFREKKYTDTAIHSYIVRMHKALDSGQPAIGMFFDLTKAFVVLNMTYCWIN
jgi:hypothetical protein